MNSEAVSQHCVEGVLVVSMYMPILRSSVEELRPQLDGLDYESSPKLVFNLNRVSYIDSAGVGYLIALANKAKRAGSKLVLCCPNNLLRRIFKACHLESSYEIYDTEEAAVEALNLKDYEVTSGR